MKTQKIFFAATVLILLGVPLAFLTFAQVIEKNIDPTTMKPIIASGPSNLTFQASSSGGNVLWDLTHGVNFGYEPANRYTNLVTALQGAGYTVNTTTNLGSVNLSTYKVLVVCLFSAFNSAYTSSEITKIQSFIQNGGGLLILGDNANPAHPHGNINPIVQTYGITLGVSDISPLDLYVTNFTAHPIFSGVSQLYFRSAGEITATSPATMVAREPGNKGLVAVAQSGTGRVVAVGDINFCDNSYLANANNQKFSINIFDWLSGGAGWTGGKFDFNDGTVQGWYKDGAYDEDGDGPFASNFFATWHDAVNHPNAPGGDPMGNSKGSFCIGTLAGHGINNPTATWWIMKFYSPDLSGSTTWQAAKGYTVEIAECMAAMTTLYANMYVVVYDKDQSKDRFFYNGTAQTLQHDVYGDATATWNHLTFDWSGVSTFPTNYTIKNVFVNLWGRMNGAVEGGVYLDEVVPIAPTTYPDISSNPSSWNYGSINVGSYSDKTFVIKNDGTANLNVTATTLTGTNASEFSIQSGGGAFTLAPNATRDIMVRFAPTSAGTGKTANLSISSNDPDENPFLVGLSGTGVTPTYPDIACDPASWNYGSVTIGGYLEKTFVIKNEGTANLSVTATTLTGTNASEFSIQSGGGAFTLAPAATRNIVVRFTPTSAGSKSANLSISSNDPDENPLLVALTGTGTTPTVPDIAITPTSWSYGSVSVGSSSDKSFVVKNEGTANLSVTATTLTGTNASEFSIQSGGGAFTLAPSATRDIVVRFSPTSAGSKSASLSISSNDPDENPLAVTLTGTGTVSVMSPIFPTSTSTTQVVGTEFWINIDVGTSVKPVTNLFGVSFDLNFSQTTYIDVVTPHATNVIPGSFLGSDVIFFQVVDETSGKVSIGNTRKAGQGGVNGYGTVAQVKFIAKATTPHGTSVQFAIANVSANDAAGASIPLEPGTVTVTIVAGLIVWPGDTNNDKIVNQADVLPLGLHWGKTGPARQNASNSWVGQFAMFWTPELATYADANGDGVVNQADVLPIGLNWNKTHTTALAKSAIDLNQSGAGTLTIAIVGDTKPDNNFFINIYVNNGSNLFGLSFELIYTPTAFVDPLTAEPGVDNIMGTDLIYFPVIDKKAGIDTGKVSIGMTRKSGQGGVSGTGLVTRITAHMASNAQSGVSNTMLMLKNIVANDPNGNPIAIETSFCKLITDIDNQSITAPSGFALFDNYPNPFNAGTTIDYQLPQPAHVALSIYDVQGHEVRHLVKASKPAGHYSVYWDGKDESGNSVASAIYFCRLEAKAKDVVYAKVNKMILMK